MLRAYIRELETMSTLNDSAPPSVRGLLEHEAQKPGPPLVPPKERIHASLFEEKSLLSVKSERRQPGDIPASPTQEGRSFTSDDGGAHAMSDDAMALISTKDLMTMDSLQTDMAGLHLQPHAHAHGSSPRSTQKYLGSGVTRTLAAAPSNNPSASANTLLLGSSLGTAYKPYLQASSAPHSPSHLSSTRVVPLRLAPDRYGKEIPMEAQWTKIRRTLVSPEVLERARVRYEARPDYVAVLGRLTREQIADYARQSAECRAARSGGYPLQRRHRHDVRQQRQRADSKSSRDEDDGGSVLWDESDSTDFDDDKASFDRDPKSYPYIVSPPSKDKTSPASTVMPKPILKNKNENHVRFEPEPHEVEPKSARSFKDERDRREDHGSRRPREARDREGSGRSRDGHRRDSERYSERYSGERDRYSSDRYRGSEGDHHRPHRDRRGDRREERSIKKKAWGETLGAVGIGGAAASLLGVLAEAAVGGS